MPGIQEAARRTADDAVWQRRSPRAFFAVPLVQAQRTPEWIAWWSLGTVALRVLLVWLYTNAGGSFLRLRSAMPWAI